MAEVLAGEHTHACVKIFTVGHAVASMVRPPCLSTAYAIPTCSMPTLYLAALTQGSPIKANNPAFSNEFGLNTAAIRETSLPVLASARTICLRRGLLARGKSNVFAFAQTRREHRLRRVGGAN